MVDQADHDNADHTEHTHDSNHIDDSNYQTLSENFKNLLLLLKQINMTEDEAIKIINSKNTPERNHSNNYCSIGDNTIIFSLVIAFLSVLLLIVTYLYCKKMHWKPFSSISTIYAMVPSYSSENNNKELKQVRISDKQNRGGLMSSPT